MAPKRIVVFRFDRDPLVCRSRVALLRRLNPGVPIHGLYGGPYGYRRSAFRIAGRRLLSLNTLWSRSPGAGRWNWRHGDIALAAWYRDLGHQLDFDILHFLEWDILLLEPLEQMFASVPPHAVGLTALTPLSDVEHDWVWLSTPDRSRQWNRLLADVRDRCGYDQIPFACYAAGACIPRPFIERYAALSPPESCHDELRLPLFAQALGFELAQTGLRRKWKDLDEDRVFNFNSTEIEHSTIAAELARPDGRRAFHPVRTIFREADHAKTPPRGVL